MFKLLWSALLGGNVIEIVVFCLGLLSLVGLAYGLGYAHGAQSTVRTVAQATAAAPMIAASAQREADAEERKRERAASDAKQPRDAAVDAKVARAQDGLGKPARPKECVVTQADIDFLNGVNQ